MTSYRHREWRRDPETGYIRRVVTRPPWRPAREVWHYVRGTGWVYGDPYEDQE